jgi:hypothetical protein
MDSSLAAAARALAAGDPLGALDRVALRDDPPALALRGIAMAQLGELGRARELLSRAARAFGPRESLSRARTRVAGAEVALAARELEGPARELDSAVATLEALGDRRNAAHARLIAIRRAVLLGRLDVARRDLGALDLRDAPPALAATAALCTADLAVRSIEPALARASLERALASARAAGIAALVAEIERARATLDAPVAKLVERGDERSLRLDDVRALLASSDVVIDGCRRLVQRRELTVSLRRRPVLFALVRALGETWPGDVPRDLLIARAFGARRANASHRARLRVEIGRLRKAVASMGRVEATESGFALRLHGDARAVVIAPPIDGDDAAVLALLADGQSWSTSALALALGASQRTVQRALADLESAGRVRGIGRARSRRWIAPPVVGFATTLLLPAPPAVG